jgi:hypothetical protein
MKTDLFSESELPFNLISDPIPAPVKTLSPQETTDAVRAGGYEHTPSMFDGPCYEVKINCVRECPGIICDTPVKSLDYWESSIKSAPWFSSEREQIIVLILDAKLRTVAHSIVSVGTLSECMCHPRDVFRPAIALNAYSIVIMHNHPSGDATPSAADYRVTRSLKDAGQMLQIPLTDHIVVGSRTDKTPYYSFKEAGQI